MNLIQSMISQTVAEKLKAEPLNNLAVKKGPMGQGSIVMLTQL